MAYEKTNWINGVTPTSAENLNKIEDELENLDLNKADKSETYDKDYIDTKIAQMTTGWNPVIETVTYASVDNPSGTVYFSGDVTTKYTLGNKLKMTNGGNVIYGKITLIGTYDSTNNKTPITFLHEINYPNNTAKYLLQNSSITDVYFSNVISPLGFPTDPDKWTLILISANYRTTNNPTVNTWYNAEQLDLAIGKWEVEYFADIYTAGDSAGSRNIDVTLSTTSNTEGSKVWFSRFSSNSAIDIETSVSRRNTLDLVEPATLFLNARTIQSNTIVINVAGGNGNTVIRATCAYL